MVESPTASGSSSSKARARQWALPIVAVTLSLGVAATVWQLQSTQSDVVQTEAVSPPQIKTVTALGRLEPKGEVIKLSAPTSSQENRVEQLLVKEGDPVKAGQVVAILDSRDRLQAALAEAEKHVKVAQTKLAVTQAGAKRGEIAAQQAEVARLEAQRQGDTKAQAAKVTRLEAELQNAEIEYQRYATLYREGAISASDRDSKRLTLQTAQRNLQEAEAELNRTQSTQVPELNQARANLDRIAEVGPVDIAASRAEVNQAIAAMHQAKANLEQVYVRSPQAGQVLDIYTRPGELVSDENGIAEIGQVSQMVVIAEVYQSDVHKVHPGQQVRVTSNSLPGELQGTVEQIGSQVRRQDIINTDPSANIDARVVEVHVALDKASSQKATKLTNLQVKAVIQL